MTMEGGTTGPILTGQWDISKYIPDEISGDIENLIEEDPFVFKTSYLELTLINTDKFISGTIFSNSNINDIFECVVEGERVGTFKGIVDVDNSEFADELITLRVHHISNRFFVSCENLRARRIFDSATVYESGWFDGGVSWERFQKPGDFLRDISNNMFGEFISNLDEITGTENYINNRLYNILIANNTNVLDVILFFARFYNCSVRLDDGLNLYFNVRNTRQEGGAIPENRVQSYIWRHVTKYDYVHSEIVVLLANKSYLMPVYLKYFPNTNKWVTYYVKEEIQDAGLTTEVANLFAVEINQQLGKIYPHRLSDFLPSGVSASDIISILRIFCYKDGEITVEGRTASHFKPLKLKDRTSIFLPLFKSRLAAELTAIGNYSLQDNISLLGRQLSANKIRYNMGENISVIDVEEF